MSDTLDAFLGLVLVVGSFLFGKKMGERNTNQHYEDLQRDKKIRLLQDEIERLKKST
jgi:hypothetical protein